MLQPDDAGFFRLAQQQILIYLFSISIKMQVVYYFMGFFKVGKEQGPGRDKSSSRSKWRRRLTVASPRDACVSSKKLHTTKNTANFQIALVFPTHIVHRGGQHRYINGRSGIFGDPF